MTATTAKKDAALGASEAVVEAVAGAQAVMVPQGRGRTRGFNDQERGSWHGNPSQVQVGHSKGPCTESVVPPL